MLDVKKALEQLNVELAQYKAKREEFQVNLQQCIGAIYATEQAIAKLQVKEEDKEVEVDLALPEEAAQVAVQ